MAWQAVLRAALSAAASTAGFATGVRPVLVVASSPVSADFWASVRCLAALILDVQVARSFTRLSMAASQRALVLPVASALGVPEPELGAACAMPANAARDRPAVRAATAVVRIFFMVGILQWGREFALRTESPPPVWD